MKFFKVLKNIKRIKYFLIALFILVSSFIYYNYITFKNIKINDFKDIEYGSKYNLSELVKAVDYSIVSSNNIDTKIIGKQKVILKVKRNFVYKKIPCFISVVDTKAPVIKIKKDKITVFLGQKINLLDNILYVKDNVDGEIAFSDNTTMENNNYYSFFYNDDINTVGEHKITVKAIDKNGNLSVESFILEVAESPLRVVKLNYNNKENNIIEIAEDLIGSPYISGSNGPNGFDCSGFVQFVYSKIGIKISRSAETQYYDGINVNYEYIRPGDILSWGYDNFKATHSAIYIGNGKMIHATNPKEGVIKSNVSDWSRGSGTKIISVRRIL